MEHPEICSKVIEILENKASLPGEMLEEKLAYRYLDAGHIDSFSILNMIIEIEDTFAITLSAEDIESDSFRTPGGLTEIIEDKLES